MMSPERWQAEQAAIERERQQLEEEAEARRTDTTEQAWLASRRGEQRHTVAEKLAAVAAASERADRRESAREHRADCGCEVCGARLIGSGINATRPRRLGSLVDKENDAAGKEFIARPASVADVAHLAADVAHVEAEADRKFGAIARFIKANGCDTDRGCVGELAGRRRAVRPLARTGNRIRERHGRPRRLRALPMGSSVRHHARP